MFLYCVELSSILPRPFYTAVMLFAMLPACYLPSSVASVYRWVRALGTGKIPLFGIAVLFYFIWHASPINIIFLTIQSPMLATIDCLYVFLLFTFKAFARLAD